MLTSYKTPLQNAKIHPGAFSICSTSKVGANLLWVYFCTWVYFLKTPFTWYKIHPGANVAHEHGLRKNKFVSNRQM